jgi:4-hydroxybenzoate polyprenyltransferase
LTTKSHLRPWLELARISNLPTVWTNTLAAWLLSGGSATDLRLFWITLGASLLYTGGMILNDAADIAFDRQHRPERPIPSGRIALRWAWRVGLIFLLCGASMMVGRGGANPAVTITLALTILAYDLYHKPWSGSVLLMGACRTLLYLAAASPLLVNPWSGPALLPGLALGAYIVGLSLIARQEAKPASTPKSPTWPLLLLLISPVLLTCYQSTIHQKVLPIALGIGLLLWINRTLRQMRTDPPRSIGPAVGKLLATIAWVDALALTNTHRLTAILLVCTIPLLLLWQKKIAAT